MYDEREEKRRTQALLEEHEKRQQASKSATPGGYAEQCNQVGPMTVEEMQNDRIQWALRRLDYHPPSDRTIPRYQSIRDAAKALVTVIFRNCPVDSKDTHDAVATVELAVMQANKAIANS